MSLLVVGSVAYDSVETPFGQVTDALGGSATYFSTASSLFAPTQLVAVVGDDFRAKDRAHFHGRDIDMSGLQQRPGRTFRWGGRYHDDMNSRDTLFTELNVFETFAPEVPSNFRRASHVFLANIDPELQLHVLDQVESPSFVACDTMNFWIEGPKRGALDALLTRIDALLINDEEAKLLTGEKSVLRAAYAVQRMGPRAVVVKRGEHGALLLSGNDVFYAPAYPLEEVVDPTGAGDSFAGGMVGYLARCQDTDSESLRQAAVVGTLCASFCVEDFGLARLAKVDRTQLARRYERHAEYMRCAPIQVEQ